MQGLGYTCIFGGGAIRGISYIGVIRALKEIGIKVESYAGSSVGAIFAALFAVGYEPDELYEVFSKINFELFKDIDFSFTKGFGISKGAVFLDWLRECIEKKYYGDSYVKGKNEPVTFSMLGNSLVVMTTDLSKCMPKEFSDFTTPDYEIASAIKISASFPGLLKPFEYEDGLLVDGDLGKNWPLWLMTKSLNQNSRILEFRLEGGKQSSKVDSLVNYLNSVYCCISNYATDYVIRSYAEKDMFDYIRIDIESALLLDFNISDAKRKEIIEEGYATTMNYFKNVLPKKRQVLLGHYEIILDYVLKIQNSLSLNKVITAKNQLGELFMETAESSALIDANLYERLLGFRTELMKNIVKPMFWQAYKLKDKPKVEELLDELVFASKSKVEELKNYLTKFEDNC